ncbi:HEAT repeat domain-containing protein [Gemmatimonas sp.]|uniref:HEAT repeat domain-containing protein n=1 Tax=Gemmatimonas sp. TaxID=1962908 RepID=UPI003983A00E
MSDEDPAPTLALVPPAAVRVEPLPSAPFSQVLSQLLDQLSNGTPTREIGRSVARAQVLASGGAVLMVCEEDQLLVNDDPVPTDTAQTLRRMMSVHRVRSLYVGRDVAERDILQLAALLNGPPRADGPSFADLWTRLGVWRITVQFFTPRADVVALNTCASDGGDIAAQLTAAIAADDPRGAFSALRAVFDSERRATDPTSATQESRFDALASIDALRVVVRLIPMGEPATAVGDPLRDLLARAGELAVQALFAQLSAAPTAGERRAVFDVIVAVGVRSAQFVTSLRHPQWYVVRNAAALLGALRVTDATEALVQTLMHSDSRVRMAVVDALGCLGTELAQQALLLALSDATSEVRRTALHALEHCEARIPATILVAALDRENKPEVQMDLICAMYASTEKETHQGLVRFCARTLAHGGPVDPAIAALEVLARHRPTSLGTFLKHLEDLDDERVRAHVERLRGLALQSLSAA